MGSSVSRIGVVPANLAQERDTRILGLVAEIVSAYVSKNPVQLAELPALISRVHAVVDSLSSGISKARLKQIEKPTAAQIKKSITPDALISFEDGRPYKTLKRHLTTHGLDPHSYRERYGLPADYPMVAANYAIQRAEIARAIGLGRVAGQAA